MLHELPKITKRTNKRVGRGSSSGKGKTSGRGQKGQKARNSVPWFMTGGSRRNRFSKTMPMIRGWRNRVVSEKAVTIPSAVIAKLYKNGDVVTLDSLVEKKIISATQKKLGVKIVNSGDFSMKVTFEVPVSASLVAKA